MFLLNSRLGLLSAAPAVLRTRSPSPAKALLLPKLRSEIAEFLNEGSLDHLTVLTAAHQCRFAVRALRLLGSEAFLAGMDSTGSL